MCSCAGGSWCRPASSSPRRGEDNLSVRRYQRRVNGPLPPRLPQQPFKPKVAKRNEQRRSKQEVGEAISKRCCRRARWRTREYIRKQRTEQQENACCQDRPPAPGLALKPAGVSQKEDDEEPPTAENGQQTHERRHAQGEISDPVDSKQRWLKQYATVHRVPHEGQEGYRQGDQDRFSDEQKPVTFFQHSSPDLWSHSRNYSASVPDQAS